MDIWEIDANGYVVNRIEDKTQDAFYRVDNDGKRMEGEGTSKIFKYGTVKERNQVILTETGEETVKIFEINGDENATSVFNILIGGSGDEKIEWGHVKIGNEESGRNLVGTSKDQSGSLMGNYALQYGYTIRESNHNHPSGGTAPSESDIDNAKGILDKFPNAKFHIFGQPYIPMPFTKSSPYIKPLSPDSKTGILQRTPKY